MKLYHIYVNGIVLLISRVYVYATRKKLAKVSLFTLLIVISLKDR